MTGFFVDTAKKLCGPGVEGEGMGLCQLMFGLGNKNRYIIVTDAREGEDILMRRTAEFDRAQ